MARKRGSAKNTPSLPLKLTVHVDSGIKTGEGWSRETQGYFAPDHVFFSFVVRFNDDRPHYHGFMGATGNPRPKELEEYTGGMIRYVAQHLEDAITNAVFDLIDEAEIASSPGVDLDKQFTPINGLIYEIFGTRHQAASPKSAVHNLLGSQALLMKNRMLGLTQKSYSGVTSNKRVAALNLWQLREYVRKYNYCHPGWQKTRKDQLKRDPEWRKKASEERLPHDLLDCLSRKLPNRKYKWKPYQVALIHAARLVGAMDARIENWKAFDRLRKKLSQIG